MAEVVTTIQQPPEFIESESKLYLDQLQKAIGGLKGLDVKKLFCPQFVADLSSEQKQALNLAQQGLGSFQPFVTQAQQFMGPTAFRQFLSPFQKDVIDTTLAEFDKQAAIGEQGIRSRAVTSGAFGGGREGVQLSEFQTQSDKNRAALQAQLLQSGFGQAQALAGQAFNQATGLAGLVPNLRGRDVATLSTLGGITQGLDQAKLDATAQQRFKEAYFPLELAGAYGSGITPLISGYPGGSTIQTSPSPSPLQTGISAGATLAGLYRLGNT